MKRGSARLALKANASAALIDVQRRQWEESAARYCDRSNVDRGRPDEWITRSEAESDRALMFPHGGEFTTGSCHTHRELAARLCSTIGWPVLLVDYRL